MKAEYIEARRRTYPFDHMEQRLALLERQIPAFLDPRRQSLPVTSQLSRAPKSSMSWTVSRDP